MLSDIEISRNAKMQPIAKIAESLSLDPESDIELYGKYKAKLTEQAMSRLAKSEKTGKLILVTAMSPTKFGEGKTTMSIGLGQALAALGHKTAITLREPSLGPVFGMKGGAAGGGYSQAVPMEDINLHFTGDIHAITSANNLLCAILDNHIYQGNSLGIDPEKITFSRCMDTNDRALKDITIGFGFKKSAPRKDGFRITAASEIMAVFCLAENPAELKAMLGRITVGYAFGGGPIYASDLKVEGSLCALLKDAFLPNLVQTLEGVPVFIHGGPFANIAHGCNSVRATKAALKLSDYTVTEAGFGSDLGAEKFLDIKCRKAGLCPDAAVLVATARAVKHHGGGDIESGFENILAHVENLRRFDVHPVLAINKFPNDTKEELAEMAALCDRHDIPFAFSTAFDEGGKGSIELAKKVIEQCAASKAPRFAYNLGDTTEEKIEKIAKNVYGAARVAYSEEAKEVLARVKKQNYGHLPVCMAKTQYSFSDDPALSGRPAGFDLNVKDMIIQTGAGFVIAVTGDVMIMPGLPPVPNAEIIDLDENGNIVNLS